METCEVISVDRLSAPHAREGREGVASSHESRNTDDTNVSQMTDGDVAMCARSRLPYAWPPQEGCQDRLAAALRCGTRVVSADRGAPC